MSKLSKNGKICFLVANDILSIQSDINEGDYQLVWAIITGDGFKQYKNMTEDELDSEFEEMWDDIKDRPEALKMGQKWLSGDGDDGDEEAFQSLIKS
jgi:hypothetical protein